MIIQSLNTTEQLIQNSFLSKISCLKFVIFIIIIVIIIIFIIIIYYGKVVAVK